MKPLVSVIVPVYNAVKYLQRCVDSLCVQTYENIEILLVDDGSTDGSSAICDVYSEKDSRIRVIHQENQGQSAARNTGLDAMRGEYVMFCDDDDYVSPDFVRYPVEGLVSEKGEIACFQHSEECVDGIHRIRSDYFVSSPTNAVDAKKMFIAGKIDGYVWNKAFLRALWENIRFPVGMEAEDIAVVLPLFMTARKIIFFDVPLYYWNRRNAFSRSRWGESNAWVAFCALLVKMEFEKAAQQIGDDELLRNVRVKNLYDAL
ncbi:MAG: glycosyltransferase, partial [Schwartzia sp.]|nr:glycosyltransferase [Schwartzia sp. (in: firmicutes)]